jgi:hypothetical protein
LRRAQHVVLVVNAQGSQREVALFGDAPEMERLVQGALICAARLRAQRTRAPR